MEKHDNALNNLNRNLTEKNPRKTIPYKFYLDILTKKPELVIRNVFQVLHDMIELYVGQGLQEYPDDPEAINYVHYDCTKLFVEGSDNPFFADRLFANRLISHISAMRRGAQQNMIYIFKGPHGCGKSTFLNNLLLKLEEYANTEDGSRYEIVWRLNRKMLGHVLDYEIPLMQSISKVLEKGGADLNLNQKKQAEFSFSDEYVDVPCPSHDSPLLMIPKRNRRAFFDDIFKNDKFKWKLFTEKEYEWVFKQVPCTICSSLYQALLSKLGNPLKIFDMIYARPYFFNRRLGEGISVYNPGDRITKNNILSNQLLQDRINTLLKDSNLVNYLYSQYAKTNCGVYALMDIKANNTERLIDLHNIVSDGIHKVGFLEEHVNSLFLGIMNPEDEANVEGVKSFSDRIEYIQINYILDLNTEVEIYRNIFGKHIDDSFLPRILHNFARVIISSRLQENSEALLEWIEDSSKYKGYCDENLLLLKMEMYRGKIPTWLTEDDRKKLTAKVRRKILAESEKDGTKGFSGRDSIKIFSDFYSTFAKEDQLITMTMLCNYFIKMRENLATELPKGFLEALHHMYDYTILQEVKESLYYYNEEQISTDIQNYMFAVNFELESEVRCSYTGEKLHITEDFLKSIEMRLLGSGITDQKRLVFRKEKQKMYTTRTLTQEIRVQKKSIDQTDLFKTLHERYVYNLKEKVLDPFLENENFQGAIKEFGLDGFKTYDKRIRNDVTFLIDNLVKKFNYTDLGAKEICMYVIDQELAKKFK